MPKIVFKNVEISYTSEFKFLGINISNFLKWNTHNQFLHSQLNKVSYMISSLRGDLSLFMLRSIYFTKLQSLIRYGIILWVGEGESVKLFKIQKVFGLVCFGSVWFGLVYLIIHSVTYVILNTSITDYNLQHNYNMWTSTQYSVINNNTKFKNELEVEFATTSICMCIYINITKS
jgi:hypothetical protein